MKFSIQLILFILILCSPSFCIELRKVSSNFLGTTVDNSVRLDVPSSIHEKINSNSVRNDNTSSSFSQQDSSVNQTNSTGPAQNDSSNMPLPFPINPTVSAQNDSSNLPLPPLPPLLPTDNSGQTNLTNSSIGSANNTISSFSQQDNSTNSAQNDSSNLPPPVPTNPTGSAQNDSSNLLPTPPPVPTDNSTQSNLTNSSIGLDNSTLAAPLTGSQDNGNQSMLPPPPLPSVPQNNSNQAPPASAGLKDIKDNKIKGMKNVNQRLSSSFKEEVSINKGDEDNEVSITSNYDSSTKDNENYMFLGSGNVQTPIQEISKSWRTPTYVGV